MVVIPEVCRRLAWQEFFFTAKSVCSRAAMLAWVGDAGQK
jgi:hypothetical protein